MKILIALLALLFLASPAFAQEMTFGWPAACESGVDCWVEHYIDHDPAPHSFADFSCGRLTYDGHDGTDIRIRDRNQQVDVVASADGTVVKVINDQPDHDGGMFNTEPTRLMHEECGNSVLLDHGNGWRTFYCHMRQGSVTVSKGQAVAKGEKLGEIGQSGLADFPHLHLEILKGSVSIDPFTGDAVGEFSGDCGTGAGTPLWDRDISYDPVMLYASGFSDMKPEFAAVTLNTSSPEVISSSAPVVYFWFLGLGGEAGDRVQLQITNPAGQVVAASDTLQDKTQMRFMRFTGIVNKTGRLKPGVYNGITQLTRTLPDGQTIQKTIEHAVTVQ